MTMVYCFFKLSTAFARIVFSFWEFLKLSFLVRLFANWCFGQNTNHTLRRTATDMYVVGYFKFHIGVENRLHMLSEWPEWSVWSTWIRCSATCGGGVQRRQRFCDGNVPGSKYCMGKTEEFQQCNTGRCPDWSLWAAWQPCSKTCNAGLKRYDAIVTQLWSKNRQ